jgi:hypothetical protein
LRSLLFCLLHFHLGQGIYIFSLSLEGRDVSEGDTIIAR